MKWKNAQKDNPPDNMQKVLISVKGVYYITIYDAGKNVFLLQDQPDKYFDPENELIYWTWLEDHS
jgi:hypothetical protein